MPAARIKAVLSADDKATPTFMRVGNAVKTLGGIAGAVGVYQVGRLLVGGMKSAIEAAEQQEVAEKKLAQALRNAGQDVDRALPGLKERASALQWLTAVGDDVILSSQAQLVAMGKLSGEGLDRATQAALDLSASGIDVKAAFDLVAKASVGYTSTLSRYGIILDDTIRKEDKFEAALSRIEEMFGGQAEAQVNTYRGAIGRLTNSWGDLLEKVGNAITQSPTIIALFTEITKKIDEFSTSLGGEGVEKKIKAAVGTLGLLAKIINNVGTTAVNATLAYKGLLQTAAAPFSSGTSFDDVEKTFTAMQENFNRAAGINKIIDEIITAAIAAETPVAKMGKALVDAGEAAAAVVDALGPMRPAIEEAFTPLDALLGEAGLKTTRELDQNVEAVTAALAELVAQAGTLSPERFDAIYEALLNQARALHEEGGVVPGLLLVDSALISVEEAMAAWIEHGEAGLAILSEKLGGATINIEEIGASLKKNLREWGINAAMGLGDALADAAMGGKDAFKQFAQQVIRDLLAMIAKALILKAIMASLGGFGGFFNRGGIVGADMGFAKGGIVGAAAGYIVPGMPNGRDSVPIMASPGEAVIPAWLVAELRNQNRASGMAEIHVHMHGSLAATVDRINTEVRGGSLRVVATELATARTTR